MNQDPSAQSVQQALQALSQTVAQIVEKVQAQQSANRQMAEEIVQMLTKPRRKTAVRGPDGRLQGLQEEG